MYVIAPRQTDDMISRMPNPPEFLAFPLFTNREETFLPTNPNRRGEAIAWLCAFGVAIAIGVISVREGPISSLSIFLLVFFLAAGSLISLGNWMDTNTSIVLSRDGVEYRNPLRRAYMDWGSVKSLEAMPLRAGWRMVVEADQTRFSFSTALKLRVGSRTSILGGYPNGDRLAALIRGMAGLSEPIGQGRSWISRRT
jgi:hypothetical protein